MTEESGGPLQVKDGVTQTTLENRQILAKAQWANADLAAQLASKSAQLTLLKNRLAEIESSNAWKLVRALWRLRLVLFPPKSARARLLQKWSRRRIEPVTAIHAIGAAPVHTVGSVSSRQVLPAGTIEVDSPIHDEWWRSEEREMGALAQPSWIGETSQWPADRFPWPLITVLLPVYNHADMLLQAAHSVLDSTYARLELVILDDGSTDPVETVLEDLLNDPRVKVYRQPNQKLPRALTHAHAYARGEFITWTSADNLMAPQALEMLANALLNHPEAVLVYADVSLIDDSGQPLVDGLTRPGNIDRAFPEILRLYQDDKPLGYETDNYINACFLYRREAARVLEGHYADDLRGLEDYDFWLRLQKCGKLLHIHNQTPLYQYRVHSRSMSYNLLTYEAEAHLARMNRLIEYETQRRAFARNRWEIFLDLSLSLIDKEYIQKVASLLPVDTFGFQSSGFQSGASAGAERRHSNQDAEKSLLVIAENGLCDGGVCLRLAGDYWKLEWQSGWTDDWISVEVWRGIHIVPLALKARQHRPNRLEFPQIGERRVVGCHIGLKDYPVDVELTRRIMADAPWAFFIYIDTLGQDDASTGSKLVSGMDNAVYLREKRSGEQQWFGGVYQTYAHFDWFWLPPARNGGISHAVYRASLALAYAAGRSLMIPGDVPCITAPYQFCYQPQADSLDFLRTLKVDHLDEELLDRYLDKWQPAACLQQVLAYANEVIQQKVLPRPDFGIIPIPEVQPTAWPVAHATPDREKIKIALAVDTLDTGGVEGVVAHLARHLPNFGIEVFLVCATGGGWMADQLRKEGIRVYLAGGNPVKMQAIFKAEKPALVNSHHAPLSLLQASSLSGIPLVETIHGTFAWFSQEDWLEEKKRSRYFNWALAVSRLVKDYYARWNKGFAADRIAVVNNAVDISRMVFPERPAARQLANFADEDFVFLTLARYDPPKNLMGLLAAFDEVAQLHPRALLLCAGQIFDTAYYEQVKAYRSELASRDRILLEGFRSDTGVLLAAADVFVLDSIMEGWSLSATEALMAGCPIIHSDCGSARELVGDGEGEAAARGILVPNPAGDPLELNRKRFFETVQQRHQQNQPALAAAMARMILEQAEWQARRSSIKAFARQAFKVRSMVGAYSQIFRQMVNQPTKGRSKPIAVPRSLFRK